MHRNQSKSNKINAPSRFRAQAELIDSKSGTATPQLRPDSMPAGWCSGVLRKEGGWASTRRYIRRIFSAALFILMAAHHLWVAETLHAGGADSYKPFTDAELARSKRVLFAAPSQSQHSAETFVADEVRLIEEEQEYAS